MKQNSNKYIIFGGFFFISTLVFSSCINFLLFYRDLSKVNIVRVEKTDFMGKNEAILFDRGDSAIPNTRPFHISIKEVGEGVRFKKEDGNVFIGHLSDSIISYKFIHRYIDMSWQGLDTLHIDYCNEFVVIKQDTTYQDITIIYSRTKECPEIVGEW